MCSNEKVMKDHDEFSQKVTMNHIVGPLEYVAPLAADKNNKAGVVIPQCEVCKTERLAVLFKERDMVQIQYDHQTIKLPIKALKKILFIAPLAATLDLHASMEEEGFDLLDPHPRFLDVWDTLESLDEVMGEIKDEFMAPATGTAAAMQLGLAMGLIDEEGAKELFAKLIAQNKDQFQVGTDDEDDDEGS